MILLTGRISTTTQMSLSMTQKQFHGHERRCAAASGEGVGMHRLGLRDGRMQIIDRQISSKVLLWNTGN